MNEKETLATRLGFIFLSAGCAIGLGNVWRFPYICGQNGGGWFVILYLLFLLIIGIPVLMMEFAMGRAARCATIHLHATLTPERPAWRIHGWAGLLGCILLMMFYTTVTGWLLIYVGRALRGFQFVTVSHGARFSAMLEDPVCQILSMLIVTCGASVVCSFGLQRGVERVTKMMMLCLLGLIVILAGYSLFLDGAEKGLRFYLVPDFARMKSVGLVKVMVEAMNHAFFTLSIGIGGLAIFGSYIARERTLLSESIHIAALDTFVAVVAGLIIIPACFAFGVDPAQGPGLIFVTLPSVFANMSGGRIWGVLFFVFMTFAALTTVITVFECIIASIRELTHWTRSKTCLITGLMLSILALPCIFGFNLWRGVTPFGAGSSILDLEDFVVSNFSLPLGGLAFVLYCCHRFGWGWSCFFREVNAGQGLRLSTHPLLRFYCAWILPVLILLIFVLGLLTKFGVVQI